MMSQINASNKSGVLMQAISRTKLTKVELNTKENKVDVCNLVIDKNMPRIKESAHVST